MTVFVSHPRPLSVRLNVAVLHIASRLFPTGFDVGENAPDTLEALRSYVRSTGRMLVWSGASESTIFGDREVNYAFRAWHDHAHLCGNHPFTPAGEAAVCEEQISDLVASCRCRETEQMARLVFAEVVGQVAYQSVHNGAFPRNQRAFVQAYLGAPYDAIHATY